MLVLSNGNRVVVEWVQHEILEAPVLVYNFEVEEFHTYFVGECGVLVHNECKNAWNEFQKEKGGKGYSKKELSQEWKKYKIEHGIQSASSSENARILQQNMEAEGRFKPGKDYAAHHIVAAGHPNKYASESRKILKKYGIDKNSAVNGVYLPTKKGISKAAYHPSIHTNEYFENVYNMIKVAESRQDIETILQQIAARLENGGI